jgi:SH3-like domain-containing protein
MRTMLGLWARTASFAVVSAWLCAGSLAAQPVDDAQVPHEAEVEASVAAGEAEQRGPVTNLPLPRYVSLRAETANARRGPSLSHRVDWEFRRAGWPLQITAEYGHWRRVRDVEGAGGWVHHSLLSGTRTAVFAGSSLVPLHVTQSETSAIRAYAEPGVVARLIRCEAEWCRVTVERADGWVRRDTLWGPD